MNARELTTALGGRWCGTFGMSPCPSHDDRTPSLAIRDGNGKVLLHCHAGCEQAAVMAALEARGLWGRFDHMVDHKVDTNASIPSRGDEVRERIETARVIWRECEMLVDMPYLRGRGITLEVPPSIRFHPGLAHGPTGQQLPAMVAAVQAADRQIVAVHRTFLSPDRAAKADVTPVKMALGPLGNGAVRLARSGEVLGLAEGIETGLSAMQLRGVPCWAACGSRLHAVAVPDLVREVHIFADNGEAGRAAAEKAADKFIHEGRRVVLRFPPDIFGDWNDVVTQRRTAA